MYKTNDTSNEIFTYDIHSVKLQSHVLLIQTETY